MKNPSKTIKGKVQLSLVEPKKILFGEMARDKARQIGNNYIIYKFIYEMLKAKGYTRKEIIKICKEL